MQGLKNFAELRVRRVFKTVSYRTSGTDSPVFEQRNLTLFAKSRIQIQISAALSEKLQQWSRVLRAPDERRIETAVVGSVRTGQNGIG